ncbi:MBL fold metallo-hydrolase [Magnetospirillum molischianum]|uniref:Metallo-beta-lactamase family protein n=1 Tax=Magnetospirillum molischianum DSM 120 TaxID=1150626 RepID=H8FP13_MAGML|nr:MBL fold metallo-hydrolase [Magnetospirillum molischianum]CCG40101.1 Metallo-beta-lactamase family protein [Magnetospirillum molischianum DSM 120]
MAPSSLVYPFSQPPEPGQLIQVAPGISWLKMPLPFALDHINLWVLDDGSDGMALVDCGVSDDLTRTLWSELLDGPLVGRRATRLIATHFHPDHIGLAGWLAARLDVGLTATRSEWLFGRMLWLESDPDYAANQADFYRSLSLDSALCDEIERHGNTYRSRIDAVPPRFEAIREDDVLTIGGRDWRAIVGGGHSPEHLCLYCAEAGVLISGDQVLPRISPIVGVWPQQPDEDPLSAFLDSLMRLRALPEDTLVLPSHGLPFRGLHARIDVLAAHHAERLERTLESVETPATVVEVMRVLFPRPMDSNQTVFAAGETVAHLAHLAQRGEIVRETGPGGAWTYRR